MAPTETERNEDGIITKVSPRSVADTVARFSEILSTRGLKLFATIDQAAEAHDVGLELRSTVLILFGSPTAGTPVMDASPLSALDLPLKVLVWDDNGATKVSFVSPERLVERYQLPEQLAHNFDGIGPLTDALVAP